MFQNSRPNLFLVFEYPVSRQSTHRDLNTNINSYNVHLHQKNQLFEQRNQTLTIFRKYIFQCNDALS